MAEASMVNRNKDQEDEDVKGLVSAAAGAGGADPELVKSAKEGDYEFGLGVNPTVSRSEMAPVPEAPTSPQAVPPEPVPVPPATSPMSGELPGEIDVSGVGTTGLGTAPPPAPTGPIVSELPTGPVPTYVSDPGMPTDPGGPLYVPPTSQDPTDPFTYEQTFIDPYIRENIMARGPESIESSMAAIAAGEESAVIRQQRERAMQEARAAAASVRGAPAAAVQRSLTQQMSEANRAATEAAAQQQLQAGQLVDEARQVEAQINAQLEAQRDAMVESLIKTGVDRNVALLQVSAELEKQRRDLTYRYWAGRLGSTTELITQAVESADFWEGGVEGVGEMAPVINMLMGFGTPEDYAGPTQRIVAGDDPQTIYTETTKQDMPSPDQYNWNFQTQSWELKPGVESEYEYMGITDVGGSRVDMYRTWNEDEQRYEYSFREQENPDGSRTDPTLELPSGIEAKENVTPVGKDEFMRQRDRGMKEGMMGTTGSMRKPEFGMAPSLTKPTALPGQTRLGEIKQGLKPSQVPAMMSNRSMNTAGPTPGVNLSNWRENAITGMKVGREILGGVDAGKDILLGRTKQQQSEGVKRLGMYAAGRVLSEGYSSLEDYLSGTDDIQKETAKYAEDAIKGLVENPTTETAANLTAQSKEVAQAATDSVFDPGSEIATESLETAADAASETASALDSAAPAVSAAFKMAAGQDPKRAVTTSGASAAGAAAGGAIGGPAGAAIGSILASLGSGKAYDAMAGKRRTMGGGSTSFMDPASNIPQYVPSGLETKKYIEGLQVSPSYNNYIGSDEGMKSDKASSGDELADFLRDLNPVKYDYKPEYGGEKDQYGIIAQDAEKNKVGQSFVKMDGNGSRVIDTGKATMVNMAAAANQQKIMDSQSMMIADLLQRISRLEGRK